MANKEDISLRLGIDFDAAHFKREYDKSFQAMERTAKNFVRGTDSSLAKFGVKLYQRFREMPAAVQKATKALGSYNVELSEQRKVIDTATEAYKRQFGTLMDLRDELKSLGASATAADKARVETAEATTQALKDQLKQAEQTYDGIESQIHGLEDAIKDMEITFGGEELWKAAAEAGKELAEPLTALFDKDIERSGKAFAKLAGKGIGGAVGLLGKGVGALGGKLSSKAAERTAAGKGGLGTKAMGGVGELMKGLGPIIQTLAKIGPILGVAAGAVMSLVKLFIDADAVVKEFNKGMVEAGGTGQFFSKTMGSANTKVLAMTSALDEFRNAAYDAQSNLDWGISAQTHTAVLQNLQAEGVQLTTMQKQYGDLNAKSAAFSKDQGSITQAAVAYSRQMGVSLQEVTSFQAEMMTEMGSTLGGTVEQFRIMSAGAEEAGIATNKFFAMIRGVSADLSLYNTRLEDAVKLLGKLGKVMSPRNAQKFMQTAMNAYKGASFQDKVKSSILAGPAKTAKIVAEDIASKNESIAKKISEAGGGTVEDIKKALEAGPAGKDTIRKALKDAEAKQGKPLGDLREAVSNLNAEKRMSKGGLVGNARALSKVSVVGAAEHKFAEASRFGGDEGSLQGMAGDALAGLDDETKQLYQNMADQIAEQREELVKQGKMTAKQAKEASWTQIYDTMDQTQKDAADGKDIQEEANKRMGTNVQSVLQKLEELMNWFTNTFYNVMLGIWESIDEIVGFGDIFGEMRDAFFSLAKKFGADFEKSGMGGSSSKKAQIAAMKSGNKELASALDGKKGVDAVKAIGQTGVFKDVASKLTAFKSGDTKRTQADTLEMSYSQGTDAEKAAAKEQADALRKEAALEDKKQKYVQDFLDSKLTDDMVAEKYGGDVNKARSDVFSKMGIEEQTKLLGDFSKAFPSEELKDLAKKGTERGSIYTHDVHLEKILDQMGMGEGGADAGSLGAAAMAESLGLSQEEYEAQLAAQEESGGTLEDIYDALRQKGVRLDKSWMDNHMKKMVEEATLDALRVGLLEYYMYKDLQPQDIADALKRGVDPKALGKGLVDRAREGVLPADAIGALGGNAEGGLVTGIRGGLAQISPAPGEGLASIGRGERIVSAGGGGGSTVRVELSLKDDLGRLIEAKAQEVVVRHGAAEKNR